MAIIKRSTITDLSERFAEEGFSAIETFLAQQQGGLNTLITNEQRADEKTSPDDTAILTTDSGDGRISKGLKGLDAMARTFRGTPLESLGVFGGKIFASSPQRLSAASIEDAREIIWANLGINQYMLIIQEGNTVDYTSLVSLADRITHDIKAGNLVADKYGDEARTTITRALDTVHAYRQVI